VIAFRAERRLRVMSGNARSEDIESAFHPKADIARRGWKVRSGPPTDMPITSAARGTGRVIRQRTVTPFDIAQRNKIGLEGP
jgi:hypothetical protein